MKVIKQLGKMAGAAVVAVVIVSLIISVYSTSPLRAENPQGNTDFVWKSDSLWMNMSEGVSFGRIDGKGFNNPEVVENPDILLLGSSHFESRNVNQDENTAYYLAENFDRRKSVYSMGMSAHTLYKVCQYLPATLSQYSDRMPQYVVIETENVKLDQKELSAALRQGLDKPAVNSSGIMSLLQKVPLFRLLSVKMEDGMRDMLLPELKDKQNAADQNDSSNPAEDSETGKKAPEDTAPYDLLMAYLSQMQEQYHTKIILMFHPSEKLNEDGSISFTNNGSAGVFAEAAEKHGIAFVDMTERFENMYNEDHHVPHGFITGKIGAGHLNKYGHKAIADALYETIAGWED